MVSSHVIVFPVIPNVLEPIAALADRGAGGPTSSRLVFLPHILSYRGCLVVPRYLDEIDKECLEMTSRYNQLLRSSYAVAQKASYIIP